VAWKEHFLFPPYAVHGYTTVDITSFLKIVTMIVINYFMDHQH